MKDSKGNEYLNVNNARITLVKHRAATKDWAGTTVLRFQAYRDGGLHMGAEIPIETDRDVLDIIRSITELAQSR
jgi:hypothetical protein